MRRATALLLAALLPACATAREEVWLAPNLASPDLVAMFERPQDWATARSRIDVFKFYERQLTALGNADCPQCGGNVLPALAGAGAFAKLREWGVDVAVEAGAIKEWGCTSDVTAALTREALANVPAHGGAAVRYVAMDEPLLGADSCDLQMDEAARQVDRYADNLRSAFPRVAVGDIEPYPHYSVATLAAWLAAMRNAGFKPAFFHVDVDRRAVERLGKDVAGDLKVLQQLCAVAGVPFGVIYWSDVGTSDREYFDDVMAWVDTSRAAVGRPQHQVFQSWAEGPSGLRAVPRNLPEADPEVHSHTRLLLEALQRP